MKLFASLMIGLASLSALSASAGELDAIGAPQGLIVRTDANGTREVFTADVTAAVTDSATAAAAAATFVKPENRLSSVANATELDGTTSDGQWGCWHNPSYYGSYYYSYTYASYSYDYYPSYGYSSGSYSYYYYYYNYNYSYGRRH